MCVTDCKNLGIIYVFLRIYIAHSGLMDLV